MGELYVPKRGERVMVDAVHPDDRDAGCKPGDVITAISEGFYNKLSYPGEWSGVLHTNGLAVCRVSPIPSAAEPAGEFYGSMPSELPSTLPAGTKWKNNISGWDYQGEALSELTLSGTTYTGKLLVNGQAKDTHLSPLFVLWHTVRRHSQPESVPFKVGDWVEWTRKSGERMVAQFEGPGKYNEGDVRVTELGGNENYVILKALTAWTPRVGEMCEGGGFASQQPYSGTFEGESGDDCSWLRVGASKVRVLTATLRPAADQGAKTPTESSVPCELCGAPSCGSPFSPLKHRVVDGVVAPACYAHWVQHTDTPFAEAIREKRSHATAQPKPAKADPYTGGYPPEREPDPYCAHRGELFAKTGITEKQIIEKTEKRDAAYRLKVAAVADGFGRNDLDRPSVSKYPRLSQSSSACSFAGMVGDGMKRRGKR